MFRPLLLARAVASKRSIAFVLAVCGVAFVLAFVTLGEETKGKQAKNSRAGEKQAGEKQVAEKQAGEKQTDRGPTGRQRTGDQIFRQRCIKCHGDQGQGTDEVGPLLGDKPPAELAKIIAKTMPEGNPKACTGRDAELVAAYIHDAFYSPTAQERLKRPRIELSRLTVRQYRNAVADLAAGFGSERGRWDEKRGLRGQYYKSRRARRNTRVMERTDAAVEFDFGESSPDPEKFDDEEFAIHWEGSVLAPEDGEYEFVVKTENACKLWVNDRQRPLIDAAVKSGDETEHRAEIQLLGGRVYPLRLEFFKAKEKTASVALMWKPPHGALETVPSRLLTPNEFPEVLVVESPFPPDDLSYGYERGTFISREWDEATTYAAIEVAGKLAGDLRRVPGFSEKASDAENEQRLKEFCSQLAERAFRRPLTDEQRALYIDRQFAEAADQPSAVKRSVLLILKSPRFLYREAGGVKDDFDAASRLSFGMWDTLPDQELLDAAARGELHTREQLVAQAERMVDDLRAKAKLRVFLHQWLSLDRIGEVSKDRKQFPEFDEQVVSDLRTSLDLFLDDVVYGGDSDFRQLLLSDALFLNGRLAVLYGADLPADAPFEKVACDPQQRAGVLSHPLLMAGFAYHSTSSPIHRGVFITRSLLGRTLRPPPQAVTPLPPDLHPDLTTRQRVILQTKPAACQACHGMINPLGFSLEHYDALGRFRSEENGRAIEDEGHYQTPEGKKVKFHGVRELAKFLADSQEVQTAFVEQLFHQFVKQPIRAFGPDQPDRLWKSFVEDKYSVRRLMVEAVATSALPPDS